MRGKRIKRCIAFMLIAMMSMTQLCSVMVQAADISGLASESRLPIVLTLGADLSEDQKNQILQFFGIELSEVTSITITNADEKEKLGNLIAQQNEGQQALLEEISKNMKELSKAAQKGKFGLFR